MASRLKLFTPMKEGGKAPYHCLSGEPLGLEGEFPNCSPLRGARVEGLGSSCEVKGRIPSTWLGLERHGYHLTHLSLH